MPDMVKAGDGYQFHVTGLTHDERGYPSMNVRRRTAGAPPAGQDLKRRRRAARCSRAVDLDDAEVVVVSYGITSRVAQRAIQLARAQGHSASGNLPHHLGVAVPRAASSASWPARVKAFVVPELNLGQMVHEVERAAGGQGRSDFRAACRRQRAQTRSDSESHPGGGR